MLLFYITDWQQRCAAYSDCPHLSNSSMRRYSTHLLPCLHWLNPVKPVMSNNSPICLKGTGTGPSKNFLRKSLHMGFMFCIIYTSGLNSPHSIINISCHFISLNNILARWFLKWFTLQRVSSLQTVEHRLLSSFCPCILK